MKDINDLATEFQALCWILKISSELERRLGKEAGDSQTRFAQAAAMVASMAPDSEVAAFFQKDLVGDVMLRTNAAKPSRHLRLVDVEVDSNGAT